MEDFYGFDLSEKTRRRENVYAKKVFSKIARDLHHTWQNIGDAVDCNHATMLHHYNSFHVVDQYDKEVYVKCMKVLSMVPDIESETTIEIHASDPTTLIRSKYQFALNELKEKNNSLEKEIEELRNQQAHKKELEPIVNIMTGWGDTALQDFIDFRLKPYDKTVRMKSQNDRRTLN